MKRKIIFVIYVICILLLFLNTVNAGIENLYDPIDPTKSASDDASILYNAAGVIVGAIKWGGVMVCAGMLMYKGIKFMTVSPDGKAEIKKELITWTIGAVILFSFTSLINMIIDTVQKTGLDKL